MADAIGAVAGLGVLAWYLSAVYVGWRLLRIGVRRDDAPARWIGTYLFVAMGIGSILISIPTARGALGGIAMTPFDRMLVALALACTVVGNLGILTFTRRVFRPHSAGARAFAVAVGALLVCGAIGHGFVDRFSWQLTEVSGVLYLSGTVLSNGWSAAESLRYYGLMRKRCRLGLAKPLDTNRFLLWGIGAGAAALILFATTLELQMETFSTPERLAAVRRLSLPVMSALGLTCAGSYFFAFLPAGWYARRFAATPAAR
jgi:hypothetical protein